MIRFWQIVCGLVVLAWLMVIHTDTAFAQTSSVNGVRNFVDLMSTSLTQTIDGLTASMVNASRYLLLLMATLDIIFYLVMNNGSWIQQGIAVVIPEIFKRLVIWSVLLYGISALTGNNGAQQIRNLAGDLTGSASVVQMSPAKTLVLGLSTSAGASRKLGSAINTGNIWSTLFKKISLKYLFFLFLQLIAALVLLLCFAILATKMLLFQLGSSIVMLFAGVGFALAAFAPFRSWGSNVISSMIKMAIHLATTYIIVLFIADALVNIVNQITAGNASINVDTANWVAMGFILIGIVGIYLSISLPSLVERMVGGGGATPGEGTGNAVGAIGIAAAAAGLGSAVAGLTKTITSGGGGEGGGGGGGDTDGDSFDDDEVARTEGRGNDADKSSLASRAGNGGGGAGGYGQGGGGVGPAESPSLSGVDPDDPDELKESDGDKKPATSAEANKNSLASRASNGGSGSGSSGAGVDGDASSDDVDSDNGGLDKALSSEDDVSDVSDSSGSKTKSSSSGGGATSESGDGESEDGDVSSGGDGGVTSTESSTDSVVEEVVTDNVRVDKKSGANNIQDSASGDAESEAALAGSSDDGGRNSSIDEQVDTTVTVNKTENVTRVENNSKDDSKD